MNKQASKINTYYRIKKTDKPNLLYITLQFEGVVYDDASVTIKTIDGAKFEHSGQQTTWRLRPNAVSEISFTVIVPDHPSYLSLNTFQNGRGAARAFLLKASKSSIKSAL